MTHFKDLVDKFFQTVAQRFFEKVTGEAEEPNYMFPQMLTPEFSVDMSFASISGEYTRVTADVVAFDSPLPLKKRSSLKKAGGEIPKIGLKFLLNEKQMNTLRILRSLPGRTTELARKVFADVENCIYGIQETLEYAFLVGLSSGVTIVPDETNTGHGVRIDYNIPDGNKFGATVKWSEADATPVDDIVRVTQRASDKGYRHSYIWMDKATAQCLRNNAQVKQQFGFQQNFVGANIPNLTESQLIQLFDTEWGLTLGIIDRSFIFEKNGVRTAKKAWTENMVVFTITNNVGTLVYSTLAEEEFPVDGVSYAKPNPYILIAKSGATDPVSEKTTGQALAFPVLQDVDSLFYLNAEEAADDSQTEGDANFDYTTVAGDAGVYTRQSVVDAINLANADLKAKIKNADSTLQKKINKLSDEEIEVFEANIVTV